MNHLTQQQFDEAFAAVRYQCDSRADQIPIPLPVCSTREDCHFAPGEVIGGPARRVCASKTICDDSGADIARQNREDMYDLCIQASGWRRGQKLNPEWIKWNEEG